MQYECSVCHRKVDGDLLMYKDHIDQHIIDLVKHDHPEWVQENGMCEECVRYYRAEIEGSVFKDAPCAIRLRKWSKFKAWAKGLFSSKK